MASNRRMQHEPSRLFPLAALAPSSRRTEDQGKKDRGSARANGRTGPRWRSREGGCGAWGAWVRSKELNEYNLARRKWAMNFRELVILSSRRIYVFGKENRKENAEILRLALRRFTPSRSLRMTRR